MPLPLLHGAFLTPPLYGCVPAPEPALADYPGGLCLVADFHFLHSTKGHLQSSRSFLFSFFPEFVVCLCSLRTLRLRTPAALLAAKQT